MVAVGGPSEARVEEGLGFRTKGWALRSDTYLARHFLPDMKKGSSHRGKEQAERQRDRGPAVD